jgi:hypothetical protein
MLLLSVLIVDAFAIAGLAGWIQPVVGAVVGLGAQVIGTIAFFVAYWVGTRKPIGSGAPAAEPAPPVGPKPGG